MPGILVIEDDPEIGQIVREILERFGHELDIVQDAKRGLATFELNRHGLVITDIIRPEKDGVEAIRDLKVLDPEARVIAMTRMRGSFNRLLAAEFIGATRPLMKPFSQEDLVAVDDEVQQTTFT